MDKTVVDQGKLLKSLEKKNCSDQGKGRKERKRNWKQLKQILPSNFREDWPCSSCYGWLNSEINLQTTKKMNITSLMRKVSINVDFYFFNIYNDM